MASWLSDAEAVLAALEAAGVRLVPAEATEGMVENGNRMGDETTLTTRLTWAAMIDFSPYAPEAGR